MKLIATAFALALAALATPALANDSKPEDKSADKTSSEIRKATPSDDKATAPKEGDAGKETGK